MKRLLLIPFLLSCVFLSAQTVVQISNVSIKDGDAMHQGQDQTLPLKGAEGSDNAVLYAGQDLELRVHFKVSTHNVRRSSVKDSAVNLIMTLTVDAGGKKDKRRTEKIFYLGQDRTSTFKETFLIKNKLDMRGIEVTFDAKVN